MTKHRSAMIQVVLLAAFAVFLTACADSDRPQEQDPAQVDVALRTDPSPVAAGQAAIVEVALAGIADTSGADVQLDIRELDDPRRPNYVTARRQADGTFAADYTFGQAGSYTLYVHYYQQGLHVTKKKTLEVS